MGIKVFKKYYLDIEFIRDASKQYDYWFPFFKSLINE